MSHPYWPQPKYLYQRAVPNGPYPDAMGDYGSRYSHGSFSRRRTYALPPYVAVERTGLEGYGAEPVLFEHGSSYYGFGGATEVAASTLVSTILNQLSPVFKDIPMGLGSTLLGVARGPLSSGLASLAPAAVSKILAATTLTEFIYAIAPVLGPIRNSVLNYTVAGGRVGDLFGDPVDQALAHFVARSFYAVRGLVGGGSSSGDVTVSPVVVNEARVLLTRRQQADAEAAAAARASGTGATMVSIADIVESGCTVPAGMTSGYVDRRRVTCPPGVTVTKRSAGYTPAGGAGAGAGVATAAVVGAGALLALLLVRG